MVWIVKFFGAQLTLSLSTHSHLCQLIETRDLGGSVMKNSIELLFGPSTGHLKNHPCPCKGMAGGSVLSLHILRTYFWSHPLIPVGAVQIGVHLCTVYIQIGNFFVKLGLPAVPIAKISECRLAFWWSPVSHRTLRTHHQKLYKPVTLKLMHRWKSG